MRVPVGELPVEAVDPVCGMTVAVGAETPSVEHEGTTYWFCCPGCRGRFARNPAKYRLRLTRGRHALRQDGGVEPPETIVEDPGSSRSYASIDRANTPIRDFPDVGHRGRRFASGDGPALRGVHDDGRRGLTLAAGIGLIGVGLWARRDGRWGIERERVTAASTPLAPR